jgi:GTP cyclohydrolase IA
MNKKYSTTDFPSPFSTEKYHASSREEKIHVISDHVKGILTILGLDLEDPSLEQTPERVARMYVDEVFSGLNEKTFPKISLFTHAKNPHLTNTSSFVITKVSFTSFCEHHLVPMLGEAYVGYIPQENIIGLSKISRIVRFFASRPQLQERLSSQIGSCLRTILHNDDIMVYIKATHTCVIARGTKDESSSTITTFTSGRFDEEPQLRTEFLTAIRTI